MYTIYRGNFYTTSIIYKLNFLCYIDDMKSRNAFSNNFNQANEDTGFAERKKTWQQLDLHII